jgi:hypothetical protein
MRGLVRSLLVALLVVMLPLKGMAAVGYLRCAHADAAGTVGTAANVSRETSVAPRGHVGGDVLHAHHAHHAHHAQYTTVAQHSHHAHEASLGHAGSGNAGHHGAHSSAGCSHCGPCCAAAAPAAVTDAPAATPLRYAPPVAAEPISFGEVVELPFRPPRDRIA